MSLDVATQPVAAVQRHTSPNTLREGKHAKQTVVWNPVWDVAPGGALRKSRRFCSLVTAICLNYNGSSRHTLHKLTRLAINIWHMPMRHFLGLCRSITAEIGHSPEREKYLKSPEALVGTRALTKNPVLRTANYRNHVRVCPHDEGCAAMRLSYKIGLVRESLKCTKCTVAACAARWFIHPRVYSPVRVV